jgi:hypothetical protein
VLLSAFQAVICLKIPDLKYGDQGLNPQVADVQSLSMAQRIFSRQDIPGTPVCGEVIPDLENATWAYTARDGSIVTYTCNVGFRTSTGSNSFIYKCTPGQPLSQTNLPDQCEIVRCPKPGAMNHAELLWQAGPSVTTGKFGDVIDYRCDPGYTGDGKAHGPTTVKKICSDSGQFEFVLETITSCSGIRCDAPLAFRNAVIDPRVDRTAPVYLGDKVGYSCVTGFMSSVDKTQPSFTLTCAEDGEYHPNDPLPRCQPESCTAPPVIPNSASLQVSGTVNVGSQVIYRCASGFMISRIPASSTFSVSCDIVGGRPFYVIPPMDKLCKAADCLPLPTLMNAHVADGKAAWRYQDIARFECDSGYALGSVKGATEFTGYCNSQGLWTIEDNPKCAPLICADSSKEVPAELLGYARMAPFSNEPIIFGMNTTVACISGATVTGTNQKETSFNLECGPDGDFTSNGICAIPCSPLPKVSHSTSAYFGQVLEYGQPPARIRCKPGYMTKSGETIQEITCARDGTLSPIEKCVTDNGYSSNPDGSMGGGGQDGDGGWNYQHPERALSDVRIVRSSQRTSVCTTAVFSLGVMVVLL